MKSASTISGLLLLLATTSYATDREGFAHTYFEAWRATQQPGVHVFRRGGEGPELTEPFSAMDVLELTEGKVTIIRHFRD